jgi:hypothetical protein
LEYRLNNIPLESTSNILIILLDITGTYEFMNAILTLNSILIYRGIKATVTTYHRMYTFMKTITRILQFKLITKI